MKRTYGRFKTLRGDFRPPGLVCPECGEHYLDAEGHCVRCTWRALIWFVVICLLALLGYLGTKWFESKASAQESPYILTLALSAEEGKQLSDGHVALLYTFAERGAAAHLTDSQEAAAYCSALRGLPQSPWGEFLLALDADQLYGIAPEVTKLVVDWIAGIRPPNPCNEMPWHFGGRNAAAQRLGMRVLSCGHARSTFFGR